MNSVSRLLAVAATVAGIGTAIAAGVSPAQAADSTAQATAQKNSTTTRVGWREDDIVGYFRTLRTCERVGRIGELRDRWDEYDCSRVRFGFNRGAWVLEVSDSDWNDGWDNDNWYGGWYHGWHGGDWNGGWNTRDYGRFPFVTLIP